MGYGNEKVVVDVREGDDGTLAHTRTNGTTETYYRRRSIWLNIQDLQVVQQLEEPNASEPQPHLETHVIGNARLEDYDISIIGEPENKTRNLKLAVLPRDISATQAEAAELGADLLATTPKGHANIGFSRRDVDIGNPDEWYLYCYLPKPCIRALCEGITAKALHGVKLGLRLKDLYTTDHPMAPSYDEANLFLRPNRADNTIDWPESASGYVMHLTLHLSQVDMRRIEVKEDADSNDEEVRVAAPDPVAVAVGALATTVMGLRTTMKWLTGVVAVCLFMLLMK